MQSSLKSKAVLLLGSNQGDRFYYIDKSEKLITKFAGTIIKESSLYESSPWGFKEQPDFLNKVIIIETNHTPSELLIFLKNIETELGRVETEKWKERIIDIDILFYDNLVVDTEQLIIPHPMLHERKFTLVPLQEIMQDYVHPVYNKTINALLKNCLDNGRVKKVKEGFLKK